MFPERGRPSGAEMGSIELSDKPSLPGGSCLTEAWYREIGWYARYRSHGQNPTRWRRRVGRAGEKGGLTDQVAVLEQQHVAPPVRAGAACALDQRLLETRSAGQHEPLAAVPALPGDLVGLVV